MLLTAFLFALPPVPPDLAVVELTEWPGPSFPGDGLNCDLQPCVPPFLACGAEGGCFCCAFGTGLGATTQPVDDIIDFLTYAIPSGTILPPGTLVYPTAIVGFPLPHEYPQCDGCSGFVTVTYPDGTEVTIEHGPFPMDSASELQQMFISFPPWPLTLDVPPTNCFSVPVCCPNTFHSYAEGILVAGFGSATTAWPVLTAQPDLNGDGLVNVQDIIEVIVNWDEPAGDCGCDGAGGVNDLLLILDHWSETLAACEETP
jgi:hypothetical protein